MSFWIIRGFCLAAFGKSGIAWWILIGHGIVWHIKGRTWRIMFSLPFMYFQSLHAVLFTCYVMFMHKTLLSVTLIQICQQFVGNRADAGVWLSGKLCSVPIFFRIYPERMAERSNSTSKLVTSGKGFINESYFNILFVKQNETIES